MFSAAEEQALLEGPRWCQCIGLAHYSLCGETGPESEHLLPKVTQQIGGRPEPSVFPFVSCCCLELERNDSRLIQPLG